MTQRIGGSAEDPKRTTGHHSWTQADSIALQSAANDIAFAVADGCAPRPADLDKYRALHNKRAEDMGAEPLFPEAMKRG